MQISFTFSSSGYSLLSLSFVKLAMLLSLTRVILFFFVGISFLVEYSVVGKGIVAPLGGEAYNLLGQLTLICAAACLVLFMRPTAFFAEYFLSCGLIF